MGLQHLFAVLGLALLCGAWVVVQRFIARHHPQAPGIYRRCDDCTCEEPSEDCSRNSDSDPHPDPDATPR